MDKVIADVIEISRKIPQLLHSNAPDYILDSRMDSQLKRLLLRLVETSHLWTGSLDGEFGGFEKTLSPFIKIYLSGIKGTTTLTYACELKRVFRLDCTFEFLNIESMCSNWKYLVCEYLFHTATRAFHRQAPARKKTIPACVDAVQTSFYYVIPRTDRSTPWLLR